ncbi:MAG: hypothetical protein IJ719_12960 [Clostridia bacterium]|nr:hypothetical protein [Clostridia bacterium]
MSEMNEPRTELTSEQEKGLLDKFEQEMNMGHRASLMKRTEKVDTEATIALVKAAMGNRSMREFAQDMGMNQSNLSRILNGKVTEIRPYTLASIAYEASPESGVTIEKLMKAQGLTIPEERRPVDKRHRGESNGIIADELLLRGYSVRLEKYFRPQLSGDFLVCDYAIKTDALPGDEGYWLFEDKLVKKITRVSIAMMEGWVDRIMAMYYRGLKAKRVSLVVDSEDLFNAMKILMGHIVVKDEISVILVSMDEGKVLDEYVAPLEDGREPKLVLTGAIEEEQNGRKAED